MEGDTKERWFQLCEQAAVEKDETKFLALIAEINRLLQEKEQRLSKLRISKVRTAGTQENKVDRISHE